MSWNTAILYWTLAYIQVCNHQVEVIRLLVGSISPPCVPHLAAPHALHSAPIPLEFRNCFLYHLWTKIADRQGTSDYMNIIICTALWYEYCIAWTLLMVLAYVKSHCTRNVLLNSFYNLHYIFLLTVLNGMVLVILEPLNWLMSWEWTRASEH